MGSSRREREREQGTDSARRRLHVHSRAHLRKELCGTTGMDRAGHKHSSTTPTRGTHRHNSMTLGLEQRTWSKYKEPQPAPRPTNANAQHAEAWSTTSAAARQAGAAQREQRDTARDTVSRASPQYLRTMHGCLSGRPAAHCTIHPVDVYGMYFQAHQRCTATMNTS